MGFQDRVTSRCAPWASFSHALRAGRYLFGAYRISLFFALVLTLQLSLCYGDNFLEILSSRSELEILSGADAVLAWSNVTVPGLTIPDAFRLPPK